MTKLPHEAGSLDPEILNYESGSGYRLRILTIFQRFEEI